MNGYCFLLGENLQQLRRFPETLPGETYKRNRGKKERRDIPLGTVNKQRMQESKQRFLNTCSVTQVTGDMLKTLPEDASAFIFSPRERVKTELAEQGQT